MNQSEPAAARTTVVFATSGGLCPKPHNLILEGRGIAELLINETHVGHAKSRITFA